MTNEGMWKELDCYQITDKNEKKIYDKRNVKLNKAETTKKIYTKTI
jgi:hypothetical protein